MEIQEKEIIEGALAMFNKYGIRSVTMDDVARELGISKKTIYKYFENKADLVHKGIRTKYDLIQERLMEIHDNATNSIEELMEIDQVVGGIMEKHNPSMHFQLQKYYPKTYTYLYEGRHALISKMISENIEAGKRDGWYRKDASTDIISFLYCSKMHATPEVEEEIFKQHSIREVMTEALYYHIRGLATPKGLEYLEEKIKNIKPKQ